MATKGWSADAPPIVAAAGTRGNPHYLPTAADDIGPFAPDEIVLLDLWAKLDAARRVLRTDITWVGYTGARVPTGTAGV